MTNKEKKLLQDIRSELGSMLANSKYGYQRRKIQLIIDMDETFGTTTDPGDGNPIAAKSEYMGEYLSGDRPLPYVSCG